MEHAFQVDLADATFNELASYAGRIAKILNLPKARSSPAVTATLDDLLGVIYALIYAKHVGFQERRDKPIETNVLLTRASHLAKGIVRTDGKWMAGFNFNSALFRISAVYHRFLKIVVGREGDVGDLRPRAEAQYRELKRRKWENGNLRTSHGQVTDLKHSQKGIYHGRRTAAGMRSAIAAVGELLDLAEAWG